MNQGTVVDFEEPNIKVKTTLFSPKNVPKKLVFQDNLLDPGNDRETMKKPLRQKTLNDSLNTSSKRKRRLLRHNPLLISSLERAKKANQF